MATRRTTKKVEQEYVAPQPVMYAAPQKSALEKAAPILAVLVVGMAFAMGVMWTKMSSGTATGGTAATNSKYKNLTKAFEDYAKEIKVDVKKVTACVSGGSKKEQINKDLEEGTGYGVTGTPGFFVNGKFLGGAFPVNLFKEIIDKELAGTGSNDAKKYSAELAQAAEGGYFKAEPVQVAVGNAQTKGSADAKVVIVEYSDFQCPYCSRAEPTVEQLLKDYEGKIRFAYKEYPLTQIHPNAMAASEFALCAGDQGKYWEAHDLLFDKQAEWSGLPQS